MEQSVLATEYIYVEVTNTNRDPTGDPVRFAFITPSNKRPDSATTWITGEWDPGAATPTARVLIGPDNGGHPLAAGTYGMHVWITDNPETPLRFSGYVTVS